MGWIRPDSIKAWETRNGHKSAASCKFRLTNVDDCFVQIESVPGICGSLSHNVVGKGVVGVIAFNCMPASHSEVMIERNGNIFQMVDKEWWSSIRINVDKDGNGEVGGGGLVAIFVEQLVDCPSGSIAEAHLLPEVS